ncbi:MAG: hypothetical protein WC319_02810 [Candidatus Paceibacterota bacterium]|jgi:hypothetical protein
MNKKTKRFFIVIVLIILALIIIIGASCYLIKKQTVGKVADWITYNNKEYRFSIDYPSSWGGGDNIIDGNGLVFCPPENRELSNSYDICKLKNNDSHILLFLLNSNQRVNNLYHYLGSSNGKYIYLFTENGNLEPIFDKMISSFKIANKDSDICEIGKKYKAPRNCVCPDGYKTEIIVGDEPYKCVSESVTSIYLPKEFDNEMVRQVIKKTDYIITSEDGSYDSVNNTKLIEGSFVEPLSNEYLLIVSAGGYSSAPAIYFGVFDKDKKLIAFDFLEREQHSRLSYYQYECKQKGNSLLLVQKESGSNGSPLRSTTIYLNSLTFAGFKNIQDVFKGEREAIIENNKINIYEWKMQPLGINFGEYGDEEEEKDEEGCKKPDCMKFWFNQYRKGFLMYEKTLNYNEDKCLFE